MENLGENYSKINGPQYTFGIKFLAKVNIEAAQSVLDVGCGTGELTALLADKVGQQGEVLGIDPDGSMIALAKQKCKDVPNLSFVQAAISEIPLGKLYDVVFSNYVFHWISDDQLVKDLAFIREHLMKPGAILACEMDSTCPDLEKARQLLPKDFPRKVYYRKGEDYRGIFKRAGLTNVSFDIVDSTVVCDDMQGLRDFLYYSSNCTFDIFDESLSSVEWTKKSAGEMLYIETTVRVLARK